MTINAQACKRCGKMFNYVVGDKLCPLCKEEMETKFQEVKKYIQENRGATVTEVAEKCDVQATWIQKWLREARLELTEGSAITLNCESCGARIRSGRLCKECAAKFNNAMGIGSPHRDDNPFSRVNSSKMRFLQDD